MDMENEGLFHPICNQCKHYRKDGSCDAFADTIPDEILSGDFIHDKEYPGDKGIRFEKLQK